MIDLTQFKDKVQSMSGAEILKAMIDGLKYPACSIEMGSYGHVNNGVCFGCAATNAIARIMEIEKLDPDTTTQIASVPHVFSEQIFFQHFEAAINNLRMGQIDGYNWNAETMFASLPTNITEGMYLPYLSNTNYKRCIQFYEAYYEAIK